MTTLASLSANYEAFWPVLWLLIGAGLCITIELAAKDRKAMQPGVLFAALGSIILTGVSLFQYSGGTPYAMHLDALIIDDFGIFLIAGILVGTAICCLTSPSIIDRLRISLADYLALVLLAASGMVLLVTSNDLIMVFLSIELMSLAIYVLAGSNRTSARSAEAAMKYFVMGAFASAFLLLGMALLYGVTGEVQLPRMAAALGGLDDASQRLAMLGTGLTLIGFAFKVGAVPFHQWVPDVYTGAPTPVTGFMAVAVKIAAFGALGRVIIAAWPQGSTELSGLGANLLWLLAALTMVVGNWLAVTQDNVKRMLAYSSIAHSGYLLMAFAAGGSGGIGAVLFYLIVYAMSTGGAFAVLTYVSGEYEVDDYRDLKGLAKKHPALGVALAIFMFSLTGIPITGGFIGKYYLFSTAIEASYVWLAVIGIVASIIGAFYYLRVVVYAYMKDPSDGAAEHERDHWGLKCALVSTAVLTMALGFFPGCILSRAENAAAQLAAERQTQLPIAAESPKGELSGDGNSSVSSR